MAWPIVDHLSHLVKTLGRSSLCSIVLHTTAPTGKEGWPLFSAIHLAVLHLSPSQANTPVSAAAHEPLTHGMNAL